ncbi:MAG: glycosyltransferase family 9 protein [Vicinamibacterales bacterium]
MPRKLLLRNWQSPGDIVMLTAAVRDLHRAHPGEFLTDVRTPFPDLWTHNPHLTPLRDDDPEVERVECHYPLIDRCNDTPCHFLHGFPAYLNERLDLRIRVTEFKGDIHLSAEEKHEADALVAADPDRRPYWLFVSGGKYDFTIKWWDPARMQAVVNHFLGRLDFVQVGEPSHHHPALSHVVDLRGRTTLRQLIRLVYHAQGVISPVSLLMHLAAAVETPAAALRHRPCVVVAGGREPPHWTAYPHHQFLHTVGMLPCCDNGGCWRSRTLPLGDGDPKDGPDQLCVDVVGALPRCMDLITAEHVIDRIEGFRRGGAIGF